jgi:hypothetical protein
MVPNSIIKPRSRRAPATATVQIVLEAAVLPAQRRKALEWQHTDFHVFERDRAGSRERLRRCRRCRYISPGMW